MKIDTKHCFPTCVPVIKMEVLKYRFYLCTSSEDCPPVLVVSPKRTGHFDANSAICCSCPEDTSEKP